MAKKLFICMIACLPAGVFAQAGQFTIEGSLGTYNAPAKMYLQYKANDKYITDSVTLANGKFKFTGEAGTDPIKAHLAFNANGNGINNEDLKVIFLEKGVITVTGTDKLKRSVAGGTPANIDNEKLNIEMAAVNSEWERYWARLDKATDQQKQSPEFGSETKKLSKDILQQQNVIEKKFITENPDSYISLFTLDSYAYTADYKDVVSLYNGLSPRLKQTINAKHLAELLPRIKAIALDAVAPDFTEADTSGKMVSLSSFRGKYILIDFWASWCVPCRAENPNIVKAFYQYKGKNFTVIGISLDGQGDKNNWLAAIHKDGLPWTQISDLNGWNDRAAQLYLVNMSGIPQNFLLDPQGKIIAKSLRGSDLENELEQIFRKR
jgi:peroxiredoxin